MKKYLNYGLRTCGKDMTSTNGFIWPKKGRATATDWKPTKECGNGLHAFLNGKGDGLLASWDKSAKWLLVGTNADVIDLGGKVKAEWWDVIFCGSRDKAISRLLRYTKDNSGVIGGTATAGDGGIATAGAGGTAIAGYKGIATAGDEGTATAGAGGTATAGSGGTATAGSGGIITLRYYNGARYRIKTLYVGEDGIKPNTAYKVDNNGSPIEIKEG